MNPKPCFPPFPVCLLPLLLALPAQSMDLLQRYPTTLTKGDDSGDNARPWEFTEADIFHVSQFHFEIGNKLQLEAQAGDVGIGHCSDGAVWALFIPREGGKLTSPVATNEAVGSVWLRFHPREISRLFPPETVSGAGNPKLVFQMRVVANFKMFSSWQSGGRAMIPEPKDLTVDVDTVGGPRRFFVVETQAQKAGYVAAFARQTIKPPPKITQALAEEAFDKLWQGFDRDYAMFVLRPDVDWTRLRDDYRPKALAARSAYEFAGMCAEMLKPLRDLHIWLKVSGADVPVFNRPRASNSNPSAHRGLLGGLNRAGRNVEWTVTKDKIGFLAIYGWSGPDIPLQCQQVLEEMRDTRGLIVDVRLNGGGSEDQAMEVAARFLSQPFVYAYSQFRNGTAHTNLTAKNSRSISPHGPWRYHRPVVLLIGQKCMSSNESFIAMMSGDPDLVTMGDHTCGSSGNPRLLQLPLALTVSIPRWIDYLPDGTPLDEHGFQPQVFFKPEPGAFQGKRDDLLSAALERLRQVPLPDKPIAGPAFGGDEAAGPQNLRASSENLPDRSAEAREEAGDASRPKVVSVAPAPDAKNVPPATELRVRFDRPMDPLSLKLAWEAGGFYDCEFPAYDSNQFEFIIPIHLSPGALHQVVVNSPFIRQALNQARKQWPLDGFQSPDQKLAGLFAWRFSTQEASASSNGPAPKALAVSPAPGSDVSRLTFIEVQFDQPMASPEEAFPYLVVPPTARNQEQMLRGTPEMPRWLQYHPVKHAFRLALVLPAANKVQFSLAGFRSATGVRAEPIKLQYQVGSGEFSPGDQTRFEAAAKEPQLLELLAAMKQERTHLTSLAERVQTLELRPDQGLFVGLDSKSASFKWAKPNRFYADASQEMLSCKVFRLGCDGQNWWWDTGDKLFLCAFDQMHTLNTSLCDPFELTSQTPAEAATESKLAYAGVIKGGGAEARVLESWSTDALNRWHIDPQTSLPVRLDACATYGVWRTRFLYDAVNQPVPDEVFAVPKLEGISPSPAEPLEEGYTRRFVNVRDGGDGRMSVRWGMTGPKGRSSSGLN